MGTYLSLTLKDRTEENINIVNKIWNDENPGYEDTFHLKTEADIRADIEYIKTDPGQAHLRYLKTVKQWNNAFELWGSGQFQVKITLGNYLCSEMAKRFIRFVEEHKDFFEELPDEYVMSILKVSAETEHKAESCLVECPYCKVPEMHTR
jgi:hypothetical protein